MQINIGHLDEAGVYNGSFTTFALCGALRKKVRGRVLDCVCVAAGLACPAHVHACCCPRGAGAGTARVVAAEGYKDESMQQQQLPLATYAAAVAAAAAATGSTCNLPQTLDSQALPLTSCCLTCASRPQGEADSALDLLWSKKKVEIGQTA